jgi:MFS family permease
MLLWSGQVVSTLGSSAAAIIYPLLILAITDSPGAAGLASALRALPYLLFSLPVGALIDRWDRKRVMIVSDVLRAAVVLTIPLALWFDARYILMIPILAGTFLVCAAFVSCVGLWYSLRSQTSLRAIGFTMATVMFVGGGYMACCCPVLAMGGGPSCS